MAKEMLINVSEGEECRIAIVQDDKLEELYMERTSSTSHVGNIYKGRVTNVEPSIQAAFVDFGLGRNGFLHISDLMPTYFGRRGEDIVETVGKKMSRRDRPPIQRCLRRGDEIVVQIIKEGIGTKGPTLSTYLSIPGRILVMMPGMGKMGVSKKIEDDTERRRLRQILDGLKPPKDVGFIIRTAGIGKSKTEIERDLKYLTRLWETLEKKRVAGPGPTELYTEGDLVTRTVRDLFSGDVEKIVIDSKDVAKRVREVIKITAPRTKNKVEIYDEPIPLFHKYDIEREIEQMYSRHVPLASGGSLVIDSTEAIVAIDVNSGKFRDHSDAETTAFRIDLEAADEITRQLKLRDLGGVIIVDFIDLRYERHRRELEERLHENLKRDRAKTKVLRMSQFGIIEMTRQRMRPSLKRSVYFDCPHCKGAGLVKTPESMSLDVMRKLAIAANDQRVQRVELAVCPDVGFYLLNRKRMQLAELEAATKKRILVRTESTLGLDEMRLDLFDARDGVVFVEDLGLALQQPPHRSQLATRPVGAQRQGGRQPGGRPDERRRGRQAHQRGQQQGRGRAEEDDEIDSRDEAAEAMDEHVDESALGGDAIDEQEAAQPTQPAHDEHDQPAPGQQGEGNGRRRRRRRGRRGRGRGRGGDGQQGQPQDQHLPRAQPNDRGVYESVGEDEVADDLLEDHETRSSTASATPDDAPLDDQHEEPGDSIGNVSESAPAAAPKRRRRRGGRGRGRGRQSESSEMAGGESSAESSEALVEGELAEEPAVIEPVEQDDADDVTEAAEPAAPAPKRRRRGGRGRGRGKAEATKGPVSGSNASAAKPLNAKEAAEVARTGSTDSHIIDDEPVDPEPPPRPASRRDYDAIAEDYDE